MITAFFLCLSPVAVDGDTLRCAGVGLVRLVGIDAPELPGHCRAGRVCTPGDGWASKRALAALVARGVVWCEDQGRDAYGRVLGRCHQVSGPNANRSDRVRGRDLSCAMIESGQAVARYSRIRCP